MLHLKHFNDTEPYHHLIFISQHILAMDKEGKYTPSIQTLTLEINHLKSLTPPHLSICTA